MEDRGREEAAGLVLGEFFRCMTEFDVGSTIRVLNDWVFQRRRLRRAKPNYGGSSDRLGPERAFGDPLNRSLRHSIITTASDSEQGHPRDYY